MGDVLKGMIFVLMIVYILSPIDVCPGPIDDLIVALAGLMVNKGIDFVEG